MFGLVKMKSQCFRVKASLIVYLVENPVMHRPSQEANFDFSMENK